MKNSDKLTKSLLKWYKLNKRDLEWRTENPDPYKVWLSEIMLQQTTVPVVRSYFQTFIRRWPTLDDLAVAELDDVLHAWQGLGYYARARNLHRCAQILVSDYDSCFPESENELLNLPGIGAYTASAISAIAFGLPSAPVDGNIARVIARLIKLEIPLPGLRRVVGKVLLPLIPIQKPGDMVQALMDLGSAICKPRKPLCGQCPWCGSCAALKAGVVDQIPLKAIKKPKPVRHGMIFWVEDDKGRVLLRRRPEKGLLGGMMEIPSSNWRENKWCVEEAIKEAPLIADWQTLPGTVRHVFTHFHLHLIVLCTRTHRMRTNAGVWCIPDQFSEHALPSVMKKVIRHVSAAVQSS